MISHSPKVRVFAPVVRIRLRHKMVQWRTIFQPRRAQIIAEDRWLDSISPVGADPFNFTIPYTSWAGAGLLIDLNCD